MTEKKEIDYRLVFEAAKIDCTLAECAALIGVNPRTVDRYYADDPQFIEAWERGHAMKRVDLRRTQWRHAQGFGPQAVQMAIHLGKHILGQTEKSLIEHTGTVQHEIVQVRQSDLMCVGLDSSRFTPVESGELQDLLEALDDAGSLRALGTTRRRRLLALIARGSGDDAIEGEFTEVKPGLPVPVEPEKQSPDAADSEKPSPDVKNDATDMET